MPIWPPFTIFGPKTPNPPLENGVEDLPDFYRMLDPLFTNKKRDYGGVYPRYRDEEGVFHHPTYHPFPPLVPPPKKLPPDERPSYVERMRLPPPEELPPTDPVPEIPPWKQPRKKKTKKQSTYTGLSKIPEIVNSNTVDSAVDELQDRSRPEIRSAHMSGEISMSLAGHEG